MEKTENFADCGLHKTMGQVHENHQSELDRLRSRERELVEALKEMRPLIDTIKNAANINDEWGRVVIGQSDAARKLYDLHNSILKGVE